MFSTVTSWIDDNFITGETELAKETENELQERFECTDKGEFNEYIGCKVEKGEPSQVVQSSRHPGQLAALQVLSKKMLQVNKVRLVWMMNMV